MRIREENCNMVLLAVVALFSGGDRKRRYTGWAERQQPVRLADRTTAPEQTSALAQPRSADQPIINVSDQPQVQIIGAPFVPNTNPRER